MKKLFISLLAATALLTSCNNGGRTQLQESNDSLRTVLAEKDATITDLLGTMNIIRLLVVLYDVVISHKSTCIDEIEYGIHTKALAFILKMYLTIADNCQIIVATHDLSLLNADFLRRDAVRLFEKDEYGSTHIRRRDYLHNTISFYRTYEKEVAPHIDELMSKIDSVLKYQDDIFDK